MTPAPTFLGENTPRVPPSSLMATPISASKASLKGKAEVSASSETFGVSPILPDPPTNKELSVVPGQCPLVKLLTQRPILQGLSNQWPVPHVSCLGMPAQICPMAGMQPPPGVWVSKAGCSHPWTRYPTTHLSIRMASVRRSFSSQVSLSSAMIFSVSWGARQSTVRSQGVWWGVKRCRGAKKEAAEP